MNRSRPILISIGELRARMSTKARNPTHYETLKVERDCTHDDIKSAYYELSKKYHPDRNTSTDARQQFQSVSDAYEILGNFSKRKQYDRDLSARGQRATTINRPTYEMEQDPLAAFYRSRMSNYDHARAQETKANFDFETWTQAHYGQTLRRSLKDKRSKLIREKWQRAAYEEAQQDKHTIIVILIVTFFIFSGLVMQSIQMTDYYDKNLITKHQKGDKNS